jgi:hypothetical protein
MSQGRAVASAVRPHAVSTPQSGMQIALNQRQSATAQRKIQPEAAFHNEVSIISNRYQNPIFFPVKALV